PGAPGSPLWNLVPLRRTSSSVTLSGDTVHDSARLGAMALPGMDFTSASCMAYMNRKGVMIPTVSAGSNHVGAMETWTAVVSWPSGAATAGDQVARASSRSV